MDDLSFSIDTRELDKALSGLPEKVSKQIVEDALQAAGNVVLEEMVALAPERTDEMNPASNSLPPGILKADLHVDVSVSASGGANVRIGPTAVAGRVARWANNGFTLTGHGKSRRSRRIIRAIPGKHFVEGAFDVTAQRALDVLAEQIGQGLTDQKS